MEPEKIKQPEKLSFPEWIEEVKKVAKSEYNFSDTDLNSIDHEENYWGEFYLKGKTPKEALHQDQTKSETEE